MSETKPSETRPRKVVGRSVAIALGIICIVLIALIGYFTVTGISAQNSYNNLQNQNKQLKTWVNENASENTNLQNQNSQLQTWLNGNETLLNQTQANNTNLQNQLNIILNGSTSLLGMITSDPSAWVNRTVTVEGVLSVVFFPSLESSPWGVELISGNQTIGVAFSASVNMTAVWIYSGYVVIYGAVEKGEITFTGGVLPPEVTYYIEAETVEPF